MRITIISTVSEEVFVAKINNLLKSGWELHGPTSVVAITDPASAGGYRTVNSFTQVLKNEH